MGQVDASDYVMSIEESAAVICSELGAEVVAAVLQRFGVHSVEELNPADLPDVFSELYAIEADLR